MTLSQTEAGAGTSRLEWCAAACGALLIGSLVGYLTYIGLTKEHGPPKIVVLAEGTQQVPGGFVVEFVARNHGDSTGAAVKIRGQLLLGDQVLEEREAVLDYVPERSDRDGGLFFVRDPRQHTIRLHADGYARP